MKITQQLAYWPIVATGIGSCRLCIVPTAVEQGPAHEPATQIPNLKVTPHSLSLGEILPGSDRAMNLRRL